MEDLHEIARRHGYAETVCVDCGGGALRFCPTCGGSGRLWVREGEPLKTDRDLIDLDRSRR